MYNSIDFAHSSGPIPAALAVPTSEGRCPLIIDLGPSLWLWLRADLPEGLTLGLLTSAPEAEQQNYNEFTDDGYARQPLKLASQTDSWAIRAKCTLASFGPLSAAPPTTTLVAIFDANDNLRYFGAVYWNVFGARDGAVLDWTESPTSKSVL